MSVIDSTTMIAPVRSHPYLTLGEDVYGKTLEEALAISGSNDNVEPRTLHYADDFNPELEEGIFREVESHIGIVSDQYGLLGVTGPGYEITQRREMLELAFEVAGLDPNGTTVVNSIGNLNDGKKFFAYLRADDLVIDPNGIADVIERGLVVGTSYDKTWPNFFGYSNIRVWCANQLTMHFRSNLAQRVAVKHTVNAEQRMRLAAQAQGYLGAIEEATRANAEKMLRVDGEKAMDKLMKELFPLDDDMSDSKKTRQARIRGDFRMMYEGEGNLSLDKAGANGWAAYNALTDLVDHASPVRKGNPQYQRAYNAVVPGASLQLKAKAADLVMSMN